MSVPQRVYGLIFNLGNSGQFRLEPLVLGIERIWLRWFRPGVHPSLYLSSEKLEEVSVELFLNYSTLMEGWSWCFRSESLERPSGKNKNTLTVSFSPLPPPLLRAHWGDPSQPRSHQRSYMEIHVHSYLLTPLTEATFKVKVQENPSRPNETSCTD